MSKTIHCPVPSETFLTNHLLLPASLLMLLMCIFSCRNKDPEIVYGRNAKAGQYQEVNGIKMYYETYGEGMPLILLHGNGGSIHSMRHQVPFFSKHYKVIGIDSRGQGQTNDTKDSLTYEVMAADVNALLDKLNIDSAYMIGQSDGAIVGLILASKYPSKVKMLAAMAPNTRPDSAVLYPRGEENMAKDIASANDSLQAGSKTAVQKLKLLQLMQNHPHITNSDLAAIKAPVMVMCGDRDVIRLSHIIEIFRAIPQSNLCVLPGSTHSALRTSTGIFNEAIYHFFSTPFKMPDSFDN
jgi:pimeloyl-ACP methyl ester carboxylesterase